MRIPKMGTEHKGNIESFAMSNYTNDSDVRDHMYQVGLVCTQYAYLEWLFEVTLWWILGLLDHPTEGRLLTGSLNLETASNRACELSHLRIAEKEDRDKLQAIQKRAVAIVDERNLAVHGVRSLEPDNTVIARVARGKLKNLPQKLSLIRLNSLNAEVASIIRELEPLLIRLKVLEDS
jgi:hypothetical protein